MLKYLLQGTVPVPEGGPWSGGMVLVPIFFFAVAAIILWSSSKESKKGSYRVIYADPDNPGRATGRVHDKTPVPLTKLPSFWVGVGMIVLGILFIIFRPIFFD